MDVDQLAKQLDELSTKLANVQDKIKSQASSGELGFATFIIIIILGLISNPSKREHLDKIGYKVPLVAVAGESAVDYESYYVLSVASVKGAKEPLTFGIFGHVFMPSSDRFPLKE